MQQPISYQVTEGMSSVLNSLVRKDKRLYQDQGVYAMTRDDEIMSIDLLHSDNTLRIWGTETGECHAILEGHTSRIWDVSTTTQGDFVASASGDGTVKVCWRSLCLD